MAQSAAQAVIDNYAKRIDGDDDPAAGGAQAFRALVGDPGRRTKGDRPRCLVGTKARTMMQQERRGG